MTEEYNLYPLHVFRAVARLGSVTRAAQELYISQPAVSSHLKTLEVRYKEALFERTPRGMLLTSAGAAVAEHADRVFALLGDIATAVEATRGEVKGKITLAASSTPGAYLAPRLLRRFQDRYPHTEPALLVGDSREVLSWLHEYRVPLGVVGETVMEAGFLREEIGQDELRLVTAATDDLSQIQAITGEHLSGRTLLLREQGSSTRSGAETLLGSGIRDFARVEELNSTEAIKQMVAAGLGVSVLSSWATELEEKAGLLAPVRDGRFRQERRFYLVRRADRPLLGTVAALWQCLTHTGDAVC
jgi:DNA-binding transcriptional LysR family regulator